MSTMQRILRYLIVWGILLALLCIVSVVRYWDEMVAIAGGALNDTLYKIAVVAVVAGVAWYGIGLLFRSLR